MTRTVSVELQADVAAYLAGIDEADHATKKLDHDVEALGHDLDKLPAESAVAAAGLAGLDEAAQKAGNDIEQLGKKTEEAGKKTSAAGDDTKNLRTRMDELETSLKTTGAEFAKTGDPELLKKFKADSSELKGLTSTVKEMEQLGLNVKQLGLESEKSTGLFEALTAGFEGGLTSPAGLGLAGVAAVPALAAAGGALSALAGAGVAGLGVFGAVAGNPETFKAAWKSALGDVKRDFLDASAPFTGVTLDAIKTIGPTVASWHLADALAPAVKYVPELVSGVESFAGGLVHGISELADKGGPAVKVLSDGMAKLGDAADSAFTSIADGAQGGAEALHDTLTAVDLVVEGFGKIVEGAENAYGFVQNHPIEAGIASGGLTIGASLFANALGNTDNQTSKLTTTTLGLKQAAEAAGHTFNDEGVDLTALAAALSRTNTETAQAINRQLALSNANVAAAQGFADLAKSYEKGSNSLDINSQRGRDNIKTIDGIVAALGRVREESIANAGSTQAATDAANTAYNKEIDRLEAMLVKLGANKQAVDALLNSFKDKTFVITQKVVTIYEKIGTVSAQGVIAGPVPRTPGSAYAEGGDPQPGWALVGEKGPELVHFQGGEHVFTAAQSRSMMAPGTARWSAAPAAVQVSFEVSPAANMTWLGAIVNEGIRNGYVVVKASQVRANS